MLLTCLFDASLQVMIILTSTVMLSDISCRYMMSTFRTVTGLPMHFFLCAW